MTLECNTCLVGDALYAGPGGSCHYCLDGTVVVGLPKPRRSGPPCFCGRDAGSGQIVAPSRFCPVHRPTEGGSDRG